MHQSVRSRSEPLGWLGIVDDHRLFAGMLERELTQLGFDVTRYELAEDLLGQILTDRVELILLDIGLESPVVTSLDLCRGLVAAGRQVLMVSGVTDEVEQARYLHNGALGFVSKTEGIDTLLQEVVGAAETGEARPGPAERHRLEQLFADQERHRAELLAPFSELSESEAAVLRLLMDGCSPHDIAETRFVSLTTVRAQIRAIHMKLGVPTQLAAVAAARRVGWE